MVTAVQMQKSATRGVHSGLITPGFITLSMERYGLVPRGMARQIQEEVLIPPKIGTKCVLGKAAETVGESPTYKGEQPMR